MDREFVVKLLTNKRLKNFKKILDKSGLFRYNIDRKRKRGK